MSGYYQQQFPPSGPPPSYHEQRPPQPHGYGAPQYGAAPYPPHAGYGTQHTGPASYPHDPQTRPFAPAAEAGMMPEKGGGPSDRPTRNGSAEEAIEKSQPWRDLVWAIIFWVQLIALVVVGGICYNRWSAQFTAQDPAHPDRSTSSDLGPLHHALPLIAIAVAAAAVQGLFWMWMMKKHGRTLIWITLIFGLIVAGLVVIAAVIAGNVVGVVFGIIFFLLNAYYVYIVRHKIAFAAAMMDVSLRSMSQFKTAWSLPIIGMLLMTGLAFVWSVCAFSIVYAVDHGSSEGARSARGFIFFLLVLSLFWTILTTKGWVHTCISGVAATYYYLAPHAIPKNPVWHAVRRASTTSFGSVAFGSFLTAFIRTVRFFVQMAYEQARNSNNQLAACALLCLECLIGCLEGVVNYINQYAFAIVAIYGRSYIQSAKDAWSLLRSRGFDAIINDSLIGSVLGFAQLIAGLCTGIITGLIAWSAFDTDWRPYAGLGFVVGLMLMMVVTEVVESAVICLFICLAHDPATLQRTKPEEYQKVMDPLETYYPHRGSQNGPV